MAKDRLKTGFERLALAAGMAVFLVMVVQRVAHLRHQIEALVALTDAALCGLGAGAVIWLIGWAIRGFVYGKPEDEQPAEREGKD